MKRALRLAAAVCCLTAVFFAAAFAENAAEEGSRLVGLLITMEDISPSAGADGALWAVRRERTEEADTEYVFEGIWGLRFICFIERDENGDGAVVTCADEGIGRADFDIENENSVKMKGTVYCVPGRDGAAFYFNPVLRTEDGRVFAVPGDPMAVGADMTGSSVGQTVTDRRIHIENGAEITDVTEADLEIMAVREPLKISLLFFGRDHDLIGKEEYLPDPVPNEIAVPHGAEYMLAETCERTEDGGVYIRREVFGREDDCLTAMSCREDGICVLSYHEILWQ